MTDSFRAFIDSTVAHLWLPEIVCKAFEDAFGLTWDSESELYVLSAEQHNALLELDPSIIFDLTPSLPAAAAEQIVSIAFPYSAFDLKLTWPFGSGVNNTEPRYYFPLKRAANDTQYTLGRAFLQEAYLIADYERDIFSIWPCTWTENYNKARIVTITSTKSGTSNSTNTSTDSQPRDKGLSTGAIAGIAVGCAVGVFVLVAAILLCVRRRRRAENSTTELQRARTDGSGNSLPTYHPHRAPSATELGGAARLELHEDHRFEAPSGGNFELDGDGLPHEAPTGEKDMTYEMDAGEDGIGGLHGVKIMIEPPTALSPRPESVMPSPPSDNSSVRAEKEAARETQTSITDKSSEKDGVRSFFGFIKAFRASGRS